MTEKTALPSLETIRHSTAHIMASAVLEMFPDAKIGIGPSIDDGFYYDFDLPRSLTDEDLKVLEKRTRKLIKNKIKFERQVISRKEAQQLFQEQEYKQELIEELPENEEITIYKSGEFIDLCRGPHVAHSAKIKANAVKLLSVAGAYWRGDENRKMLQRIYGTAFNNVEELNLHLKKLEDIKKRDHRNLGRDMDLFSIHPDAGSGLIYWHPKGARIRTIIESFWKDEHIKSGYQLVISPHIGRSWLWEKSGHLDCFKELMYSPMEIDGEDYYLKPMNCPFHILIYKSRKYSYRNLPVRWAELGTVYRYERSGVLHGLLRVRGFTQDDAHIICTPEQIEEEILQVIKFSLSMWKNFGFTEIKGYLATRPDKSVGDHQRWDQAISSLQKAAQAVNLDLEIDEGGGAFYGPKIDLKIKDALGREWQMTTIQFDFNLPERFEMSYIGDDGKKHRPYMVHRALLGSLERFMGVLIEHYGGAFPVWLMPTQAMVIPIMPECNDYAEKIELKLQEAGIRVEADYSRERFNAKIRDAQIQKIPYMLILGKNEKEQGLVSMRLRKNQKINDISLDKAIELIKRADAEKTWGA